MSTFAESLKKEVARLAKKELKGELAALRKAVTAHRSEIASLRRVQKTLASEQKALLKDLGRSARASATSVTPPSSSGGVGRKRVFSAEALAAKRMSLGLTREQMAKLVGASSLSIYKWEKDGVTPRAAQLERIFAVLKMGKREVLAHLEQA